MLDLRRLHVFHAVATQRSFSAAAAALDYTQSSVSQHVTNLERELGATLIDRTARPVAPTEAGELVLRHAEDLLARARSVERELDALRRGEAGTLRVGGFYTAWATFMPEAVASFSRARPNVQLELQQLEPAPALRRVQSGDLDLAVVYRFTGEDEPDDERLAWTHLADDPFAVVLPTAHRLASRRRVALRDLAGERWVAPPPTAPYTRLLYRLYRELGDFEPNVVYETADIAMAQPLVAAGLAVSMLPALGIAPQHEGVVVLPVAQVPSARTVSAVRLAGRRSAAVTAMVGALQAATSSRASGAERVKRPPA